MSCKHSSDRSPATWAEALREEDIGQTGWNPNGSPYSDVNTQYRLIQQPQDFLLPAWQRESLQAMKSGPQPTQCQLPLPVQWSWAQKSGSWTLSPFATQSTSIFSQESLQRLSSSPISS